MRIDKLWLRTAFRYSFLCLLLLTLVAGCGQQNQSGTTGATQPLVATTEPAAQTPEATPSPEVTAAPSPPAVATDTESSPETEAVTPAETQTSEPVVVTPDPGETTSATSAPAETEVASPEAGASEDGFTNPVFRTDFADPGVLKVEDTYYAYATNAIGRNIQVARSTDLIEWELLSDAMPALPGWAQLGGSLVWAPEVAKIGDLFVLYYTARDKQSNRQCVGVATSEKPEGKFKDTNDKPLVCQADEGGTIDASPFFDDGKWYLYFKNDGNCCSKPTHLYVQEMTADGLGLVGEPARLVRNDRAWEGRVVEAPTMWKHDDRYYLFFSANDYAGIEYAIGYATCESPLGPCEDAPENPIVESLLKKPPVIGPGHQTIVMDDDGETWIVYHAWEVSSGGTKTSRRFMWIDPLVWEDGKPVVKGPTIAAQPLP